MVKQREGQFFTSMPIVKFILNSLPLEKIIAENELPPKAIDYSCGSSHFLNELALQIKPLVAKHKKLILKNITKKLLETLIKTHQKELFQIGLLKFGFILIK
jgi:type I restriction-modification system DNA methylase subunit